MLCSMVSMLWTVRTTRAQRSWALARAADPSPRTREHVAARARGEAEGRQRQRDHLALLDGAPGRPPKPGQHPARSGEAALRRERQGEAELRRRHQPEAARRRERRGEAAHRKERRGGADLRRRRQAEAALRRESQCEVAHHKERRGGAELRRRLQAEVARHGRSGAARVLRERSGEGETARRVRRAPSGKAPEEGLLARLQAAPARSPSASGSWQARRRRPWGSRPARWGRGPREAARRWP